MRPKGVHTPPTRTSSPYAPRIGAALSYSVQVPAPPPPSKYAQR